RPRRDAVCVGQRRSLVQRHAGTDVLEDHAARGVADDVRRSEARVDLCDDQHRRRRVPDQLWGSRPIDQRIGGALRPSGHLRRNRVCRAGERAVLLCDRTDRAMATRVVTVASRTGWGFGGVAVARTSIIIVLLAAWEALARSGLLFRDV